MIRHLLPAVTFVVFLGEISLGLKLGILTLESLLAKVLSIHSAVRAAWMRIIP